MTTPLTPALDHVVDRKLEGVRAQLDNVRVEIARTRRGRLALAIMDRLAR